MLCVDLCRDRVEDFTIIFDNKLNKKYMKFELTDNKTPDEKEINKLNWKIKIERLVHYLERMVPSGISESSWEKRAKIQVENSGIAEEIEKEFKIDGEMGDNQDSKDVVIVDFGSGKQHINREIYNQIKESRSELNLRFVGLDRSDKATDSVSFENITEIQEDEILKIIDEYKDIDNIEGNEEEAMNKIESRLKKIGINNKVIESVYSLTDLAPIKKESNYDDLIPIKSGSADVVKIDYLLQEVDDEKAKEILLGAKRILKEGGFITIIDHIENEKEEKNAMIKNIARNRALSSLNFRTEDEWEKLFKECGLSGNGKKFREDDKSGEKYPAQYIFYKLKIIKD